MSNETKENDKSQCKIGLTCGVVSPGPKYNFKAAVGFIDHTPAKNREPAYTIPKYRLKDPPCIGPGPKYFYELPGIPGYTFPRAVFKDKVTCTPGPKYTLPGFWSPAYTIVGRPKRKCQESIAGPYPAPIHPRGPAYTFGLKGKDPPCNINPPIRGVGPTTIVKPRPPAYDIVPRRPMREMCRSPGPKYTLPKDKAPAYSFGVRYHKCVVIPRTDCDERC